MPRLVPVLALICLSTAPLHAQRLDPDALTKAPRYDAEDVKPAFAALTEAQLREAVKVVSGRNSAAFSFNAASIEVHLPRVANSAYIEQSFPKPRLLDAKGADVSFEKEQGLFDDRSFSTEIRLTTEEGRPVDFARAIGTAEIRYPLLMETRSVRAGSDAAVAGVEIEGPFVRVNAKRVAEAVFGNRLEAVRAYDATGKRLQRVQGYTASEFDGSAKFRRVAFHGPVARAEVDIVTKWTGIAITYDLPPVPPLPESLAGTPPAAPDRVADTPGGRVTVTVGRVVPPEVRGDHASLSPEEARKLLAEKGLGDASAQTLFEAVVGGKVETVRLCLIAGIDPSTSVANMPALVMAAMTAQVEAGQLLVAAGADVDARDETGATALIRASSRCEATLLVEALIEAGADVNVTPAGGTSALMMADTVKCEENADLLRAAGAKPWR